MGDIILDHLQQSKAEPADTEQIKRLQEGYKKKAKFRTEKAFMTEARYVSIFMINNTVRFEPKNNKFSKRTFYNMPEQVSVLHKNITGPLVGQYTKESWNKCVFGE